MGASKSRICRARQLAGNSNRISCYSLESEIRRVRFLWYGLWRNSFFGKHQFLFLRPSTDWTRPIHIIQGNLLAKVHLLRMLTTTTKYLDHNTQCFITLLGLLERLAITDIQVKYKQQCFPYSCYAIISKEVLISSLCSLY